MLVDKASIASNIAKYRKLSGLTQQELAEKTGLTKRTIAYYESGKYNVTLKNVGSISNALGISVAKLLGGNNHEEEKIDKIDVRWLKRLFEIKKLPVHDQKAIVKYITMLVEKNTAKKH